MKLQPHTIQQDSLNLLHTSTKYGELIQMDFHNFTQGKSSKHMVMETIILITSNIKLSVIFPQHYS